MMASVPLSQSISPPRKKLACELHRKFQAALNLVYLKGFLLSTPDRFPNWCQCRKRRQLNR